MKETIEDAPVAVKVMGPDWTIQDRMVDVYRLAAIGELAAGVAHELNNSLQAITATSELLLLDELPNGTLGDINTIKMVAERAGVIVRNLLAVGRPRPPDRRRIDLGTVIEDVLNLRASQMRLADVGVEVQIDSSASAVHADPDQITQILHNLIGNATHAIREVDDSGIVRLCVQGVADSTELLVEDTGPGISDDARRKIFQPFFTTKPVGQGTGLGLAISLKLARENGGDLSAENWGRPAAEGGSPGEGGARFILTVPASGDEASDAAEPKAKPTPHPHRERVLIIDDEPTVASVAKRYLKRAGYDAESCHTAEDALELIGRAESYDAIVIDLQMPGMGGEGFYRVVREHHTALVDRLIFASGDIVTPSTQAFLKETQRPVLTKPYELKELGALIEAVTETTGERGLDNRQDGSTPRLRHGESL